MIRSATEPARSLDTIMPELPAAVVELVARALRFERSERWASATEMKEAVLGAYRQLFGSDPDRAELRAIVERTSSNVETSPTVPSPFTPSGERELRPQADETIPPSALPAPAVAPRAAQTTTSTPVSSRHSAAPARKGRVWPLVAGSAAAALAALWMWRGSARPGDPAKVPAPAAAPAPTSAALAPATSGTPAVVATPSAAESAPPPAPAPIAPATSAHDAGLSTNPPKPPTPGSTGKRKTTGVEAPASSTKPSAPASAPSPPRTSDNPLKLELQ